MKTNGSERPRDAKWRKKCRMFEQQGGLCWYCKCLMVLVRGRADGIVLDPKIATFEHLISRLNPDKGLPNHSNEQRLVLACFECNQERSKLDQRKWKNRKYTKVGENEAAKRKWYRDHFNSL
jgi:hypothetical protein